MKRPRTAFLAPLAAVCVLVSAAPSCASLEVTRDTETSGGFRASARTMTFLSWDLPRGALQVAHENVADTGLPNLQIESESTTDWGWWNWVLEIVSFRKARVSGTWGYDGE